MDLTTILAPTQAGNVQPPAAWTIFGFENRSATARSVAPPPKRFGAQEAARLGMTTNRSRWREHRGHDTIVGGRSTKKIALLAAFCGPYLIWGLIRSRHSFAIQSIPPFLMAGAFSRRNDHVRDRSFWRRTQARSGDVAGRAHCRHCLLLFGNGGVTIAEKWESRPDSPRCCRDGPQSISRCSAGSRARRASNTDGLVGTSSAALSGSASWSAVRLQTRRIRLTIISSWGCRSYSSGR